MKSTCLGLIVVVASLAATAWAANPIINPTFTLPTVQGTPTDCPKDQSAPDSWTTFSGAGFNLNLKRNSKIFNPGCGKLPSSPTGAPRIYVWTSFEFSGGNFHGRGYQIVTLSHAATGNETYAFTGFYHLGSQDATNGASAIFSVYDGADTAMTNSLGTVSYSITNGETHQNNDWPTFSVTAKPAANTTQLIVAFDLLGVNSGGLNSLHVASVDLEVTTVCTDQPSLNAQNVTPPGVAPALGVQGATDLAVTLSGTNLVGSPTVSLTGPQTINAKSVAVNSPTQATAVFDLPADAIVGDYDLNYVQSGCPTVTKNKVFTIYLSQFKNGSFELPAVSSCTSPTETVPTSWRTYEVNAWGSRGILALDGFYGIGQYDKGALSFLPSCPSLFFAPPNNGAGYGTMSSESTAAEAYAYAFETVPVTPGAKYTISGYFAGSGTNTVILRLRNGGIGGTEIASKTIHTGTGNYGWLFNYVAGQAVSNAMTVEWNVHRDGGSENASHADNLSFAQCSTEVSLASITPSISTNDKMLNASLVGTGFTQAPTSVFLSKAGVHVEGAAITRVSDTQVTCSFNLAGYAASPGRYDLVVQQGGCFAVLPGAVAIMAPAFTNGDFLLPTVPDVVCGSLADVNGLPTGWYTNHNLHREGTYPQPACPLPGGARQYGSMSSGSTATLQAWQTIFAVPGQNYRFSGWFGSNSATSIKLLDGFEDGTVISSQDVYSGTPDNSWVFKVVSGIAISNAITAVWEIDTSNGGGNAAGLQFGSICHTYWADADDDGDVDMDDFAVFQRCYTLGSAGGGIPADQAYCSCFDQLAPFGQIDDQDLPAFIQCASGPGVPVTAPGCQ